MAWMPFNFKLPSFARGTALDNVMVYRDEMEDERPIVYQVRIIEFSPDLDELTAKSSMTCSLANSGGDD